VLGFAGIGRDIAERLAYEDTLERQNERLERFASVVSHDLRSPLSVALARLRMAREEPAGEHLKEVDRAHERMERLIEELLTLTKEGEIATDRRPVDLAAVVRDCWRTVETHDATLRIDGDCRLEADENRLRQLVANLVRNALQHGGRDMTVRVGPLQDTEGFYVADDGPGIPGSERGQVFEGGFTSGAEGIGVGLSIVKRVADAHGWDVGVTDGSGGGARFEFRFRRRHHGQPGFQ
jgi:signal transduction histidine kinase